MIQAPLGEATESRLAALPPDGATVFMLGGGRARGALLAGTRMLQSMRANHGLGPLEIMVLGSAYRFERAELEAMLAARRKEDRS
jgi:molecular chaperone Hsp33